MERSLFDSHCHADSDEFDVDRSAMLQRALTLGVRTLLVAGVRPAQWAKSRSVEAPAGLRLLRAFGVYPEFARELPELFRSDLSDAAAIGEFGLDRRLEHLLPLEEQLSCAKAQLSLARDLNLPVILHVINRHGAMLELLKGFAPLPGVVHAFSGSADVARAYVRAGLHIGIGTRLLPLTEMVAPWLEAVPVERRLLESDAPFGTPRDSRSDRNEPENVARLALELGKRGESWCEGLGPFQD